MLRLPSGTPVLSAAGWPLQDLVGRTVRAAFEGLGAVPSSVGACVVVLMPRTPDCFAALGACHDALDAALALDENGCRIDVEPLPTTVEGVGRVLDSLHR